MDELIYTEEEYDPKLGLYQKWISGDPNQKIEKSYCMAAFQFCAPTQGYIKQEEYHKYAEYIDISVMSIINNSKDWYIRIYIDESILTDLNPDSVIWRQKLDMFKLQPRVQIVCIKMPRYFIEETHCHEGLLAVMFRYLTIFDPNVSICLFRDIDNVWTDQHHYFVEKWLERGDDVCVFLNQNYKRQQAIGLTPTDIILEDKYYTTVLSGLWNIRKPFDYVFPKTIWQKIYIYIEDYTKFAFDPQYIGYKYYGIRFSYGFDELALSRILIPILINTGSSFYAIPIKIYDVDYFFLISCLF